MTYTDLERAYQYSRKNTKRSLDQIEFEVFKYINLNKLLTNINERTYKPIGCYSFIHYRSAHPREVFAAPVSLKIIQSYLDIKLRPIIEEELIDRTFNNRIGKGPQ